MQRAGEAEHDRKDEVYGHVSLLLFEVALADRCPIAAPLGPVDVKPEDWIALPAPIGASGK